MTSFIIICYGKLTHPKQVVFKQTVLNYYSKLKAVSVNVPKTFSVATFPNKSFPVIHRTYYKLDVKTVPSASSPGHYLNLVYQLSSVISLIINNKLRVSIDPKPSNFAYGSQGLIYFDFVPPLVKNSKNYWLLKRLDEQDQKTSWKLKRYFTPWGLLQLFAVRLLEIKPENKHLFYPKFSNLVKKHTSDIEYSQIKLVLNPQLWFHAKLGKNLTAKIRSLVKSITIKDRDTLRLLYLLIHPKITENQLRKFYRLSKSPHLFPQAKNLLLTTDKLSANTSSSDFVESKI